MSTDPVSAAAARALSAAIAAGAELRDQADEQARLRRVAELVARGVARDELLDAVAREAGALLREPVAVVGFDEDRPGAEFGADADLLEEVRRTRKPARRDDAVGVPVIVAERVWGALSARGPGLPAATEDRLQQFADLVGTALANAHVRTELQAIADEQAALRRVAELAAREAPAPDVLRAVADEAARLAGVQFSIVMRYEPDGGTELVALSGPPPTFSLGMRAPPGGTNVAYLVWQTGQPARMDDLRRATGRWPETALASGFSASAAVPIKIRARLWGTILVVARDRPLPAGTEEHLLNFAELAGIAISGAEDRRELRTLAHEQGSLRRVAELVARGAALEQVFAAASGEASTLFEGSTATLVRFTDDGAGLVVAATGSGPRGPSDADLDVVRRTGAPHRSGAAADPTAPDPQEIVTVPVTVEGEVWGALSVAAAGPPVPAGAERRLIPFADLVAAAIAAAQYRRELLASRARVLTTADETRRRVQRDVHDGAQQRLVHTIINLKLARDASADRVAVSGFVDEALRSAEGANRELRDVVRGILPAALTRGGLRPGIESLVADLPLPVELRVDVPRLPVGVETTAYFIVAEALTNVVKHAGAGSASVEVARQDGRLVIDVRDDGHGGADARKGTGLTGLHDRVAASDGRLTISSPPGQGTHVRALLPTS
jgi:signal transduction histidine kinase